jgi:hypothetical protein
MRYSLRLGAYLHLFAGEVRVEVEADVRDERSGHIKVGT